MTTDVFSPHDLLLDPRHNVVDKVGCLGLAQTLFPDTSIHRAWMKGIVVDGGRPRVESRLFLGPKNLGEFALPVGNWNAKTIDERFTASIQSV